MNHSHRLGLLRRTALFGPCVTLVVLGAASCGDVTSLGENAAQAGEGGSTVDVTGGGEAGSKAGGGHARGGGQPEDGGGQGGQGTELGPLPYPLYPTLPVSADCSCDDDDSVCSAAGQCVPRCEPGGVCAMWRVDRDVQSWLTSEDILYFVIGGQVDDLGNPLPGEAGQASLWKVQETDSAPTRLAALPGRVHWLLAHFSGKIYVGAYANNDVLSVIAVDESGTLAERALPDDALDTFSVSPDGVFVVAQDGSIARLTLGIDGSFGAAFEPIVPGTGDAPSDHVTVLASDRLWREHAGTLCSFDLADLQAGGSCVDSDSSGLLGAEGSRVFFRSAGTEAAHEFDMETQMSRLLWRPQGDFFGFNGTLAGGFITAWIVQYPDSGGSMLGRFPTEGAAMDPTPLVAQQVVRAMVEVDGDHGGFSTQTAPAVTSGAVYWTQWFSDESASRYIFRAPLP